MRRLTQAQSELLDAVERAVRSIRHPLDSADVFHHQCLLALELVGLRCAVEVPMVGGRRVDIVVVNSAANVALEIDRFRPRRQSLAKFADMPPEVLRMLVLRRRYKGRHAYPHVDRTVLMESSLRPVAWLVDGLAILEETADPVRRLVIDRRYGDLESVPTVEEHRPSLKLGVAHLLRKGPKSVARVQARAALIRRRAP